MDNRGISRLRAFTARVLGLFRSRKRDEEFDEEMQAHLQLLVDRFVAQGLSQQDAAAAARRQFGNTTLLQEDRRELRTLVSVEDLGRDLRYALRSLGRSRAFAAVAIATLGLGIGASTAIFSVIDNVLLEPFPYKDAGRMVFLQIHDTERAQEGGRQGYTSNELLEFAEQNHVFEGVIAASDDLVLYKRGEGVELLYGAHVTPGTFEFFGMPALHGRVMQPADYQPGAPPVFVMRHKTWMERFDGDPGVLNKTFVLNGTARTLIGIMPPRFGWYEADVLIPETPIRGAAATGYAGLPAHWFLLGRLKPGVSKEQAAADATVIANHLAKISPQDYPAHFRVFVKRLGDTVVGQFESTLYTILAAVGLLLLIGCGNVANLMLARATVAREGIRVARGAGSRAHETRATAARRESRLGGRWSGARHARRLGWIEIDCGRNAARLHPRGIRNRAERAGDGLHARRRRIDRPDFRIGAGAAGGPARSERPATRRRQGSDRRIPHGADARCSRGHGSGVVADTVDRRRALDAELCGAARGASGTAGGPRLRDAVAVAGGSLQNGRATGRGFFQPLLARVARRSPGWSRCAT